MNFTNTTDAAIFTAFKNAVPMKAAGYTIAQGSNKKIFSVVKPGNLFGDFYTVDTCEGYEHCNCLQFAKVGFCKHQVFVDDYITDLSHADLIAEYEGREL